MRDLRQLQMDARQRSARAEADARAGGGSADQAGRAGSGFHCGVARIVSNDGDGNYTVTEQWADASDPPAWIDAAGTGVLVNAPARDLDKGQGGQADQLVFFWRQRRGGGKIETLLDVPPDNGPLERLTVAYHWEDDGAPNPTENIVTIDTRDWRRFWVQVMAHYTHGAPAVMNDNNQCHVPTAQAAYWHFFKTAEIDSNTVFPYYYVSQLTPVQAKVKLYVDGADGGKLKLLFKNESGSPAEMSFYADLDIYRTGTPTGGYESIGDNH
ncbi:MAG: hypothetical protein NT031_20710 [Planctomycetota bacterium]|nr:hypothetical protein [Planctomycetota bacterium]